MIGFLYFLIFFPILRPPVLISCDQGPSIFLKTFLSITLRLFISILCDVHVLLPYITYRCYKGSVKLYFINFWIAFITKKKLKLTFDHLIIIAYLSTLIFFKYWHRTRWNIKCFRNILFFPVISPHQSLKDLVFVFETC